MDLKLTGSKCSHRKYMQVLCNAIQYFVVVFVCVYLSALQQDLTIDILLLLPVLWLWAEVFTDRFAQLRL